MQDRNRRCPNSPANYGVYRYPTWALQHYIPQGGTHDVGVFGICFGIMRSLCVFAGIVSRTPRFLVLVMLVMADHILLLLLRSYRLVLMQLVLVTEGRPVLLLGNYTTFTLLFVLGRVVLMLRN